MDEESKELHKESLEDTSFTINTVVSNDDLRFGWGRFRPQCLQAFNNAKCFIAALAFVSFIQGMTVNGFTILYLLTLEKRFQLTSTELGLIAASNDVSGMLLTALVSFYGTYRNKIKWLGYGSVLTGLGCLLFSLPQLLVGPYEPISSSNGILDGEVCRVHINGTSEVCFADYGGKWYYIFTFFVAQLLMGAGTTPLFTLGPAYIDENVNPKSSPIYLAVFYALTLLGPGLGFISGGSLLDIYVDVNQPEGSNMTPEDPRWIGAWWLGYLVGGSLLCLFSWLLLGFPRELPGAKAIREQAVKDGHVPKENDKLQGKFKDFLPATIQLFRSPVFLFNSLAITSSSLFGAGIGSFIAKILQLKFNLNPSITGIVIGIIMVPGVVGGILIGGVIVRRFDLKKSLKMAARFCVIASVFTIGGCTSWFIPGCNTANLAGVVIPYRNSSSIDVNAACNLNCSCSLATINPVCGDDGWNYFSPCHAGCTGFKNNQEFTNCTCIQPPANKTEGSAVKGSAVKGYCDLGSGCMNYIPFLLLTIVVLFSVFVTAIANKTVVLRCVPYNQRAYALGIQFIFQRSIGFLPGPLFFGAVFDAYCLLWGESCGKRGNCQFYEMNDLTTRLGIYGICFTGVSFVFYFLSFWFCKPTIQDEAEEKQSLDSSSEEHVTHESSI